MVTRSSQGGAVVANGRTITQWLLVLVGFMVGAVLTYAVCQATMTNLGASNRFAGAPIRSPDKLALEPAATASCPPAPTCPSIKCEPSIVTIREATDPADQRFESIDPQAIQSSLVDAMRGADIRASFALDCTSYPCLAVFADEPPSSEDRTAVIDDLVASLPNAKLISSTHIDEDQRITWVLVVAESGLSNADQAAVEARVEDMLRP